MASQALIELSKQLATPKPSTSTYKVKKGDTLNGIAEQLGVDRGSISGYKSNNPDLIYEGEDLSVGTPKKTSYVDEIKTQLNDTTADTTTAPKDDEYGTGALKVKIADTEKKRDDAFAELKDISTKTFDDEYTKRKLKDKKERLTTIDSEIATAKQLRDDEIGKIRSNPGLSAAQMTGDIKKLADYQNDVINNKIAERNSVAGEYNTELAEIDKLVSSAVKDKTLQYGYFDDVLKGLTGQVSEYSKAMREQLQNETENDQFDRQLAQALQIAQIKAEDSGSKADLELKSDPNTGDPLYWYNKKTGEITYIDGTDGQDAGGGTSFEDVPEPKAEDTSNVPWYKRLFGGG